MNYKFVLYTILNFLIWLWESAIDVISILFLPINIFWKWSELSISELKQYAKRLIHKRFRRLSHHGYTMKLTVEDGKLAVSLRSYDEDVRSIEKQMNTRPYRNLKMLFDETLKIALQHTYIAYTEKKDPGFRFFQFHTEEGEYMFDFPLTPSSENQEYSNEILAMLKAHGFRKHKKDEFPFLPNTYSIVPLSDELTSIAADLGKDRDKAVTISTEIFTKIFRLKNHPNITLY